MHLFVPPSIHPYYICLIFSSLDLKPLLTPDAVTELVMASMKNVPSSQPKAFGHSYTPIAAAGTEPQVQYSSVLIIVIVMVLSLNKLTELF